MNKKEIERLRAICLLECMATNLVGELINAENDRQHKLISEQINAIDIALDALHNNPFVINHGHECATPKEQRNKTRFECVTESPEKLAEFIDSTAGNCEAWCTLNDPIGKYLPVDPCDGKCRAHMVEYLNEVI